MSFLTLALQPVWYFAPLAMLGVGVGFYMLHNTLQTEATQMMPQARGTGVTLFASMYFLGQTLGVALGAPVMDRFGGPPLFVIAALVLPALAFWFTGEIEEPLVRATGRGRARRVRSRPSRSARPCPAGCRRATT